MASTSFKLIFFHGGELSLGYFSDKNTSLFLTYLIATHGTLDVILTGEEDLT